MLELLGSTGTGNSPIGRKQYLTLAENPIGWQRPVLAINEISVARILFARILRRIMTDDAPSWLAFLLVLLMASFVFSAFQIQFCFLHLAIEPPARWVVSLHVPFSYCTA